jgi:neutral ceramidase
MSKIGLRFWTWALWLSISAALHNLNPVRALSEQNAWQVGVARADITPHVPLWLSGFSSRSRLPTDREVKASSSRLFARALAFRGTADLYLVRSDKVPGRTVLVLVALDLIGASGSLTDRIFHRLSAEFGLERAQVRLCFSHTHSGPVVGDHLQPLVPEDPQQLKLAATYAEDLIEVVVGTVREAINADNMERVWPRFGIGRCQLAVNRRDVDESTFGLSDRGLTDPTLPVLWFIRVNESLNIQESRLSIVGGLYGYAAHASVLTSGYEYSGDYPAETSAFLESAPGFGGTWLYVAGAGGDQNIYPRGTQRQCERHARKLANAVSSVVQGGGRALGEGAYASHIFVQLPFRVRRTRRELIRWLRGKDSHAKVTARRLLGRAGTSGCTTSSFCTNLAYTRYPMSIWVLGDVRILFLGGEPTVEYGIELRRSAGVDWVVGYADDVMGYIGTKAVLNEGKREGSDRAAIYYGLPATWGAEVEEIIKGAAANLTRLSAAAMKCNNRFAFDGFHEVPYCMAAVG